jgi:hypothetical protein
MTKNPRDERVWTNFEVQEDAQGYLAAQSVCEKVGWWVGREDD